MANSVYDLFSRIVLDTSEYEKGLKEASEAAKGFLSILGSGIALAASAGAAAITGLVTAAVSSYSEYEQLVGGVETLFGDSADKVKEYADNAYKTAGMSANQYMETVTSFAASLLQSTKDTTQKLTDEEIEVRKNALDEQYNLQKKAFDKQYDSKKEAYDNEYDALKDALDDEYSAMSETLDKEVEDLEKMQDKRLSELKAEQDAEIEAYEKAAEAKIKLINEEYTESLKLIDEEKYNQIKAIDEQINALNAQTEAERAAAEQAEQEQRKAELQKAVNAAKSAEEREKAQKALNDYNAKLERQALEASRKAQIDGLKEQKTAINEEADAKKEALKQSRDEQLTAEKEANKTWLEETKKANAEEISALTEAQKEELDTLKKSNKAQLDEQKKANDAQLKSLKSNQTAALESLKEYNADRLAEIKKQNDAEKKLLKEGTDPMAEISEALGVDTAKAAEIANMAIIDMSDNANKMGTSIESIQNAYMGFSKQNYQMLDNLKLGYGGTKTEMERLLADAEKLTGIHYDISNLADVYSAIHEIQSNLYISGLTTEQAADLVAQGLLTEEEAFEKLGTTAKEATSTIQGSAGSLKASWENLVTGFARDDADMGVLFDNFIESAETSLSNLLPTYKRAFDKVIEYIPQVGTKIAQKIGEALGVSDEVNTFITEISTAFETNLPLIEDAFIHLGEALQPIIDKLTDYWESGDAAEDITSLFTTAIDLLSAAITITVDTVADIIDGLMDFVDWLNSGTDAAEALKTIVVAVTTAFIVYKAALAIGSLITAVTTAVQALTSAETLAEIAQIALNVAMEANPIGLVIAAIAGLVAAFKYLWDTNETFRNFWIIMWQDIKESFQYVADLIVHFVKDVIPQKIDDFKTKIGEMGLKIIDAGEEIKKFFTETIPEKIEEMVNKIKEIPKKAKEWGKDMVANFTEGMTEGWSKKELTNAVDNVGYLIKERLGHSHPTKGPLADDYTWMPDMMSLFTQGIEDNTNMLTDQIEKSFDFGNLIDEVNAPDAMNANVNNAPVVAAQSRYGDNTIIKLFIDKHELAKAILPSLDEEKIRLGVSLAN